MTVLQGGQVVEATMAVPIISIQMSGKRDGVSTGILEFQAMRIGEVVGTADEDLWLDTSRASMPLS